jgi:hypothetical protein
MYNVKIRSPDILKDSSAETYNTINKLKLMCMKQSLVSTNKN